MGLSRQSEAEREVRRKKVAALLLSGATYRQIAEVVEVSIGTIHKDVKIIMGRWQKEQIQALSELKQLELQRLDLALHAIWKDVIKGKTHSIGAMLKIMERRAKLLGLDLLPAQTQLNIDMSTLTEEQLTRIANGESPTEVLADTASGAG